MKKIKDEAWSLPNTENFSKSGKHKLITCKHCEKIMRSDNLKSHMQSSRCLKNQDLVKEISQKSRKSRKGLARREITCGLCQCVMRKDHLKDHKLKCRGDHQEIQHHLHNVYEMPQKLKHGRPKGS